jgi:hypothetical protein
MEKEQLYRVDVEGYFIMISTPSEAKQKAENLLSSGNVEGDDLGHTFINKITKESELPHDWKNCYPYGAPGVKTCDQILKPILEAERKCELEKDSGQLDLFENGE